MSEKIIKRPSDEMYKEDQVKYSILVDRRRALPQIRDGLKLVQRRVMYGALLDGLTSPSKKTKSASLAGTIMKRLHPHSSSYDAIVNMAAWYKLKMPLIYGNGNWGNVSGSGAASERYTKCAMSEFGYETLISELDKSRNIVDWIPTYLRTEYEPEYLPAKVPILLINGSFGIGVGMAVNIPSHNLNEVIDATRKLLKNPNSKFTLIPDLCQPCELIDTDWSSICESGSGSFKVRGVITTEADKKGNYILHIRSLPQMTNTDDIYHSILKYVESKQLPMVKDVLNSLDDNELPDIIIKLKPGSDPEYVKNYIYSKTGVQQTVSVNFMAVDIDGITVKRFSYREYLLKFIEQRLTTKFRLYSNLMQQDMTRFHKIDAFIKAMESGNLDKIIDMIRKTKKKDNNVLIEKVIKLANVTDLQAKFIIETPLYNLSLGRLSGFKDERKLLAIRISKFKDAVTDDGTIIKNEIDEELKSIAKKYGSPRLCKVIDQSDANNIPHGNFKIVITEGNYIRKIPDVDRVNIIKKDIPKFTINVDNAESILIFDSMGKVYNLPVHKVPITDRNNPGTDLRIMIKNFTSDVVAVFYEPIFEKIMKENYTHYLVVLTKNNTIKKLQINDFLNVNPSGLLYSKLKDNDTVVDIALVPHNFDIVICSGHKALRCNLSSIPLFKRNAVGSKAMNTDDPLTSLSVIYPDATDIIVLTKSGKVNRFNVSMLMPHSRATKGSTVIKLSTTDEIFGIYSANENNRFMIVTTEGREEVIVGSIKEKSSIASGSKVFIIKGTILKAYVLKSLN